MQATDLAKNASHLDEDFCKSTDVTPCLKMSMESNKKLPAGTVLQLMSVTNISVPKRAQEESRVPYDSSKHSLKLAVTDGSFSVMSYVFDGHPKISDQTPPGTKLKVLRDVSFKSKTLVFTKENLDLIGGHVKQLVDAWRVNRDLDRTHHVWGAPVAKLDETPGSGPPRWKAFDFKQGPIKLPILQGASSKPVVKQEEEKTSEFDQQRKANISKLTEQLGDLQVHKTFGEGRLLIRKDVADIMKEGFTEEEAESALQRFKTVKAALKYLQPTNGADDHKSGPKLPQSSSKKPTTKLLEQYDYLDDDTPESRAEYERQKYHSGSKTLFDFVQTAIPGANTTTNTNASTDSHDQSRYEPEHNRRGRGQFSNFRGGPRFANSYAGSPHGQEREDATYHYDSGGRGYSRGRGSGGSSRRRGGRGGGGGGGRAGGGGSRSFYRSRGSGL